MRLRAALVEKLRGARQSLGEGDLPEAAVGDEGSLESLFAQSRIHLKFQSSSAGAEALDLRKDEGPAAAALNEASVVRALPSALGFQCGFLLLDVATLRSLEGVSHVFSFDLAMPPWVLARTVEAFNKSVCHVPSPGIPSRVSLALQWTTAV